jgi:hypothetical protein
MRRGLVQASCLIALGLVLASCAAAIARNPVPAALEADAQVVGMGAAPIRFWGDPPNADAIVKEKWAQVRASRPEMLANGRRPVVNFLALSGGGSDGAFGAAILGGWTAAGTRPEFDLVTGVSTGTLTAPFAFLGPKYDAALKEDSLPPTARTLPSRGLYAACLAGNRSRATRHSPKSLRIT